MLYNKVMTDKQSKIEVLQEIQPQSLLDSESGTAIELSFKKSQNQDDIQYPSMYSKQSSKSNSWKNNRNSQDQLDQVVVGVRRSSYALEDDSFNSDSYSFACLNASVAEEDVFKSKLVSKLKELKEEQPAVDPGIFNQSIFTDRPQKPQNVSRRESASPEKQEQNIINYGKSFYMTRQQPIAKPEVGNAELKQKQKLLKVSFSSKNYFLQIKQASVEIDRASLEDLYNQLFKKQIFVPLFNYERFEEWARIKDYSKYTPQCDAHMNFRIYLERYVAYLNDYCPANLQEVIQSVQMIQQGNSDKRPASQPAFSLFSFDFSNLLDNLKAYMSSSKYEVLRKAHLAKIKSIKAMMKEQERWKMSPEHAGLMNSTTALEWEELAEIELLLSFQSTEELCSKKIESSPELKFKEIWLKYREVNRNERTKFITALSEVRL